MESDPIPEIDGVVWKKKLREINAKIKKETNPEKLKKLNKDRDHANANLRYIYGCGYS